MYDNGLGSWVIIHPNAAPARNSSATIAQSILVKSASIGLVLPCPNRTAYSPYTYEVSESSLLPQVRNPSHSPTSGSLKNSVVKNAFGLIGFAAARIFPSMVR